MFKLFGIILAFTASSAIGFLKSYEIKSRKDLLVQFRELLLHISTEIGYFKEPLPQIFERIVTEENTPTNIMLRQCLLQYKIENSDLPQLWKRAIDQAYDNESLTKEDLAIMKKCGDFLGQSDFKGQQEHFQLLNFQLDRQIEDAETAIKTKGRLYGKAGVSIGLVIAIALI